MRRRKNLSYAIAEDGKKFVCEIFREHYGVAATETASIAARRFLNFGAPHEVRPALGNLFMTKKPLSSEEITQLTSGLSRLARNLWWTWDQEAQEVFSELSPRGWQNLYHNAVAILHEVSEYELRVRLQDPDFAERVREVLKAFDAYMNEKLTWAQQHAPALSQNPVAYFSAEFGFHETLPIAAGGLGILAGDHAK